MTRPKQQAADDARDAARRQSLNDHLLKNGEVPKNYRIGYLAGFDAGYDAAKGEPPPSVFARNPHNDTVWHINDCLPWLIKAADTVLHKYDYDGPDYEEMQIAAANASRYLTSEPQQEVQSEVCECGHRQGSHYENIDACVFPSCPCTQFTPTPPAKIVTPVQKTIENA